MTATITPLTDRDRQALELRLLHGAMVDVETWRSLRALQPDQLASAAARRLYRSLGQYYAVHDQPLGLDGDPLLAYGLRREDLDELAYHIPVAPESAGAHLDAVLTADAELHRRTLYRRAQAALHDGDAETARQLLDQARASQRPPIDWIDTATIFDELPAPAWVVPGLQLGPGRCHVIAGYGASAKTLSAQALAIAVAAGLPAWGHYDTTRGQVRHIDYEQGALATRRRYQRLAVGMGVDTPELGDRLQLAAMPRVRLDSPGAAETYARACDGAAVVLVDSLRAATAIDENSSEVRGAVDALTRVSEATGATVVLIHHAGKPQDRHSDARTVLRGSSGIYDAAGCVLGMRAGQTPQDPREVTQVKQPADAEGAGVEPFGLAVRDVELGGHPTAGVIVERRAIETMDPVAAAAGAAEADARTVLTVVRAHPGCTTRELRTLVPFGGRRADDLRHMLLETGQLRVVPGPRGAQRHYVAEVTDA